MYITMCLYNTITILFWVLSIYPFIKHYTFVVSIITVQFSHTHNMMGNMTVKLPRIRTYFSNHQYNCNIIKSFLIIPYRNIKKHICYTTVYFSLIWQWNYIMIFSYKYFLARSWSSSVVHNRLRQFSDINTGYTTDALTCNIQ